MDLMKWLGTVIRPGAASLLLAGLTGCLPNEPPDNPGVVQPKTIVKLDCNNANPEDWQVVPPPCEVVACWHQPAELVSAVEFVRFGREDGLEEHVRIEPDGAYEVMIVQNGEIVEQYEGVLAPAAVAELAGLLYDWDTDAEAITPQECPFPCGRYGARPLQTDAGAITPQDCPSSCGRYEITYAGRDCGWPAGCAVVPRALKCVARRVMENTALDLDSVCVRLEFLDR